MLKRFSLRIPKWLNEKISKQSKLMGISKNTLISFAIREYIENLEKIIE